ncbi:hypothetical protein GR160_15285 [Flavobacterium sp. Sd200]|uniref:hypothetical protein n=1 Tax=Flavobacterium sp. Sd200 TaxID=2692211 RepID=UPI00136C69F6|nr:hypothetical protein [Flavobacterium sp. Sd200]MXN92591.1 hypothetical protein [Flavobacterium sp. Sd200]
MNKILKIFIGLITLLILQACNEKSNSDKITLSKNTLGQKKEYTCEECIVLIDNLVKKSSYDSYFKSNYKSSYSILVNEATKEKITIQILLTDNEHNNIPIGWLELDLQNDKLRNITNDDENPEDLQSDASLINQFKDQCMQCCTD